MPPATPSQDSSDVSFHDAQPSKKLSCILHHVKLAFRKFKFLTKKPSNKAETDQQYSSRFLAIACSLARVNRNPTFGAGSYPLRPLKWPESRFGGTLELLVPPPCVDYATMKTTTSIADFVGKIPDRMRAVYRKANPEKLVDLMLPEGIICNKARRMAAVFWLWLCITDDILEDMSDSSFKAGIADMQAILSGRDQPLHHYSDVSFITRLLTSFIEKLDLDSRCDWRKNFITCLLEIVDAFRRERPLMEACRGIELRDWMSLRVLTISARPFMVLSRASLGLPTALSAKGNPFHPQYEPFDNNEFAESYDGFARLEATMQCIMGLQNDILGFERDNYANNYLNAVQILILQGLAREDALTEGIRVHNYLSGSAVAQGYKLMHTLQGLLQIPASSKNNSTSSLVPSLSRSNGSITPSVPSPTSHKFHDIVQIEDSYSGKQPPFQLMSRVPSRMPSMFLRSNTHILKVEKARYLTSEVFGSEFEGRLWATYITILLGFGNAMATWHVSSKRYVVKACQTVR